MTQKSALEQDRSCVLTINGGSSSIKFALYQKGDPPKRGLHGKVDRIGLRGTRLTFHDPVRQQPDSHGIGDFDHGSAAHFLCDWMENRIEFASIGGVGYRIVNGGAEYNEPQLVAQELLDEMNCAAAAQGRVLLAHLGNGASLAAVRGGKCNDTSMGFTPAGDLDPGLARYLSQTEHMTRAAVSPNCQP